MTHPNDMTTWSDIRCQRGHGARDHVTREVEITLGGLTGYRDLAPIPARFARSFKMLVWDPEVHPVDGGPYCPCHDAVSEAIVSAGVWEPSETIATLSACSATSGSFVDFGAQLGWFSLVAASCGLTVHAYEADADNMAVLEKNFALNGWSDRLVTHLERVGPRSEPLEVDRIDLAKIDLEGAERDGVKVLWPKITEGRVDNLLIEVSPVFADYYPDLVADLVSEGFRAYELPPKRRPPHRFDVLPRDLEPWRIDTRLDLRDYVASWHQADVWFTRPDASWR